MGLYFKKEIKIPLEEFLASIRLVLCITKKVLSSILLYKIIKLSHPRFHEKNLVNAINIFLNNPLLFIFFNN